MTKQETLNNFLLFITTTFVEQDYSTKGPWKVWITPNREFRFQIRKSDKVVETSIFFDIEIHRYFPNTPIKKFDYVLKQFYKE